MRLRAFVHPRFCPARAYTLIEVLICMAILSVAFTGLFTVTIETMREGRYGAEAMMARQQTQLADRALFRDVKNAVGTLPALGEFTAGPQCLILTFVPLEPPPPFAEALEEDESAPWAVIYHLSRNRLKRRLEGRRGFISSTVLVENLSECEFRYEGGMVRWRLATAVAFQDRVRRTACVSAARLGGAP
ncbi:MAG: hypothetical protein Kow0059_08770 [Candidatus Sumerlaeia bacterium]